MKYYILFVIAIILIILTIEFDLLRRQLQQNGYNQQQFFNWLQLNYEVTTTP